MNEQILAKLIEIANYVFDNLLSIKDGVYTAAELCNEKDALGNKICLSYKEVETHTVEVGTFKCSIPSDRIFFTVWKFEQLCKVKQKDKVHFNKGVDNKEVVKEVAVYYKSNGNELSRRRKALEKHSDNVATDGTSIFYKVNDVWYDLCIGYSDNSIKRVIDALTENPEYFKECALKKIENNEYFNKLELEMYSDLGIDKNAAIQSRENCLKRREQEKIEREQARIEKEKQREEAERKEKEHVIKETEQKVINNEKVSSENFELLCKVYNIKLTPKQIGCLRDRIVSLNGSEYSYWKVKGGRAPKVDGLLSAYDMLREAIQQREAPDEFMTDEEVEALFSGNSNSLCSDEISHENNVADTTIPNDKENQSESIPDSKNEVLNKDSKYYLSFEIDKHNFEIDFSGELDTPYRINETFDELLNCLHDTEYYELARSELYERILRYSHEHFGSIGYVNHCRLGNVAAELFMQRIMSDINIRGETFR